MIAQVIQKTSAHPDADLVSGILITKESAKAIKEKVNFLISERRKQQLLYFTGSSIFIPRLSGLYVMSYVSEPFMELLTAKQSDDFADAILRSQANEILFDAEESYLSGDKSRIACWKYIEAKIHPEFVYDRTTSGWKVFKRRSSSTISRDNTVVLKVLEP
jgi:hypothetical protein